MRAEKEDVQLILFGVLRFFELSHSKVSPDQPVLYYLSGGPKRSFVREELQVVPEDSEAPPKNVK